MFYSLHFYPLDVQDGDSDGCLNLLWSFQISTFGLNYLPLRSINFLPDRIEQAKGIIVVPFPRALQVNHRKVQTRDFSITSDVF